MTCDACGKEVSPIHARYGKGNAVFCSECHEKKTTTQTKSAMRSRQSASSKASSRNETTVDKNPRKFKTLLTFGRAADILGQVITAIGIIIFIFAIIGLTQLEGDMTEAIATLGSLLSSIGMVVGGLLTTLIGQTVSCFVEIERNTSQTYDILKTRIK